MPNLLQDLIPEVLIHPVGHYPNNPNTLELDYRSPVLDVPACSSLSTTSRWPPSAAACSAVRPCKACKVPVCRPDIRPCWAGFHTPRPPLGEKDVNCS